MSTVTEIRDAIRKLPAHEAWRLAEELRGPLDALWDKQFEEDVEAGRLDRMVARARGACNRQDPAMNAVSCS